MFIIAVFTFSFIDQSSFCGGPCDWHGQTGVEHVPSSLIHALLWFGVFAKMFHGSG